MAQEENKAPDSPETQPVEVREELEQEQITHEGVPLHSAKDNSDYQRHMGALEDNVANVMPPVSGPSDLLGSEEESDEVSPRSELTPG